jgi:hypothetical protein
VTVELEVADDDVELVVDADDAELAGAVVDATEDEALEAVVGNAAGLGVCPVTAIGGAFVGVPADEAHAAKNPSRINCRTSNPNLRIFSPGK